VGLTYAFLLLGLDATDLAETERNFLLKGDGDEVRSNKDNYSVVPLTPPGRIVSNGAGSLCHEDTFAALSVPYKSAKNVKLWFCGNQHVKQPQVVERTLGIARQKVEVAM